MADIALHHVEEKEELVPQASQGADLPTGRPFENIPEPPEVPREVGVWVHPQERGMREWYKLTCRCGEVVTFPWLGFQTVTCPTCGSHLSSQPAVVAETPDAAIQAQARVDEDRLKLLAASEVVTGRNAKKFAEKFKWIKTRGDAIERFFLGKPYKYGNFKMYKSGRIILSPSSSFMLFPPLIVAPPLLVVMTVDLIPEIYKHIVLAVLAVAFLAITMAHLIEPGIVRKGPPGPPQQDTYQDVNGTVVLQKWCRTCNVMRPLRASHCAECDVCVDRFDHHCHITGTCVGRRNFRQFIVFVFGIAIADAIGVGILSAKLFHWGLSEQEKQRSALITTWVLFGLIWALATTQMMCNMGCAIYFMTSNNYTTRELMKGVYGQGPSPFNLGSRLGNLYEMLRPPPASQVWGRSPAQLDPVDAESHL
eukprot:TRINITY_DN10635_c0_g1_i4.p1 TRINITY_DN10635_c0_g1~~TRINITY_DN10635_c0_g1_i4.p1  ORF type:complete len:435 (+),score=125.72 TRINITY_DN10635_c0_g1_i4:40-1305(+)